MSFKCCLFIIYRLINKAQHSFAASSKISLFLTFCLVVSFYFYWFWFFYFCLTIVIESPNECLYFNKITRNASAKLTLHFFLNFTYINHKNLLFIFDFVDCWKAKVHRSRLYLSFLHRKDRPICFRLTFKQHKPAPYLIEFFIIQNGQIRRPEFSDCSN